MQQQSVDGNICAISHALPTMAIADFFHAHNISDAIVDPPSRFLLMLKFAQSVGSAYWAPNRKEIGDISLITMQQLMRRQI